MNPGVFTAAHVQLFGAALWAAFVFSSGRITSRLRPARCAAGRATFCFRKIDGKWLIAHDHASVPLDFKSGRALLNLEP